MRLWKFKPFSGPQSFCFKDPDTEFDYFEATEEALIKRIVNYRIQNRLDPILFLSTVLQNYWCSLPENKNNCEMVPPLRRGLLMYIKGGIALIDSLLYPAKHRVAQEEADRRAAICVGCKYNVFPDKGPFVKWADTIAEHSVGKLRAAHYDELGNCEICTCVLKAKCWYKGSMGLVKDQEQKMIEVGCWQPTVRKD